MRNIGLHVRVPHALTNALTYAQKLELPIFQCFLIDQIGRRPLTIDNDIEMLFKKNSAWGPTPYIHGSYFINLAHLNQSGYKALKREIAQAKQLGAAGFILHPGSATGTLTHQQGIAKVAKELNKLMDEAPDLTFVLENTAHGGKSVGSDLHDFKKIKAFLDYPERLRFCIDTAHAHTYGYDITTPQAQEAFIALLDDMIGLESIALIHLNDSYYPAGSRIDKHAPLGRGTIGLKALRSFAMHPALSSIPLILELPVLPSDQEAAMLQTVRSWHLKKEPK